MPDLTTVVARLRAAGCVFAEEEAAVIAQAAGTDAELERFVEERVNGVPLEHVVGWAEFGGVRVVVEPGVFVPRPRSELLVTSACRVLSPGSVLLDVCCGSGAIALALATRVPGIRVIASDIDERAVAVARRNLAPIGGDVFLGDLYSPLPDELRAHVDVLTVVAPYVPTSDIGLLPREARDFEPHRALDGGGDGLAVLGRVIRDAPRWLRPGGVMVAEVAERQAERVVALMADARLVPTVEIDEDSGASLVSGIA